MGTNAKDNELRTKSEKNEIKYGKPYFTEHFLVNLNFFVKVFNILRFT